MVCGPALKYAFEQSSNIQSQRFTKIKQKSATLISETLALPNLNSHKFSEKYEN